jgi:hypothetical protein
MRRGATAVALVLVVLGAMPGRANEALGQQGSTKTTSPNNTDDPGKNDDIEGRSGLLAAVCELSWDTPPGASPAIPSLGFTQCFADQFADFDTPSNDLWTFTVEHQDPVPNICQCENSPDIQFTGVAVDSGDYIGKIRKFTDTPLPQGGYAIVYLNGYQKAFSTTVSPPVNVATTLNNRMRAALQGLSNEVSETTRYFAIESVGPSRAPLLSIGFESHDLGLVRSEVALDPPEVAANDWLACVEDVPEGETKCGD